MQKQTEYGRFEVTGTRQTALGNTTSYAVTGPDGKTVTIGNSTEGRKRARTLAATLESAEVFDMEEMLPPELLGEEPNFPSRTGDGFEEWASVNDVIPVRIATAGKAAMAGWLYVIHRHRPGWISNKLGVSEQTVRQYLSDLREGRR